MSNQETSLEELAYIAKSYALGSLKRQEVLTQLINRVMESPRWFVPRDQNNGLSQALHEEILEEAKQEAIVQVCKQIDQYDARRSQFMTWIKQILEWRYKDIRSQYLGRNRIDEIPERSQEDNIFFQLRVIFLDLIEQDTNDILKNENMKKYPHVNMRELLLQRLDKKTWREMEAFWNVPSSSLESFFRRKLEELNPFFREELD